MTLVTLILLCLILVLVALPPHYDPAIRLREWLNNREDRS